MSAHPSEKGLTRREFCSTALNYLATLATLTLLQSFLDLNPSPDSAYSFPEFIRPTDYDGFCTYLTSRDAFPASYLGGLRGKDLVPLRYFPDYITLLSIGPDAIYFNSQLPGKSYPPGNHYSAAELFAITPNEREHRVVIPSGTDSLNIVDSPKFNPLSPHLALAHAITTGGQQIAVKLESHKDNNGLHQLRIMNRYSDPQGGNYVEPTWLDNQYFFAGLDRSEQGQPKQFVLVDTLTNNQILLDMRPLAQHDDTLKRHYHLCTFNGEPYILLSSYGYAPFEGIFIRILRNQIQVVSTYEVGIEASPIQDGQMVTTLGLLRNPYRLRETIFNFGSRDTPTHNDHYLPPNIKFAYWFIGRPPWIQERQPTTTTTSTPIPTNTATRIPTETATARVTEIPTQPNPVVTTEPPIQPYTATTAPSITPPSRTAVPGNKRHISYLLGMRK